MPNKALWTLRAFDENGDLLLTRDVELDLDALDDKTLDLHVARFLNFLRVAAKIDHPARIEHEVDALADVRERLAAAVTRARSDYKA